MKHVVLTSLSETEGLVWEGEITPGLVRELSDNLIADAIEKYVYFEAALAPRTAPEPTTDDFYLSTPD